MFEAQIRLACFFLD